MYANQRNGTLEIDYKAESDAPTPLNLTNHAYFNLADNGADIREHYIWIDADRFLEVNDELIPTQQADVGGTVFDFRKSTCIGPRLTSAHGQLATAGGFDHCYLLRANAATSNVRNVAVLSEPVSERELTVSTNAPGLQFYTGNFLAGTKGRHGRMYRKYAGLCLEPGAFPNAPNSERREEVIVEPGRPYQHSIRFTLRTP